MECPGESVVCSEFVFGANPRPNITLPVIVQSCISLRKLKMQVNCGLAMVSRIQWFYPLLFSRDHGQIISISFPQMVTPDFKPGMVTTGPVLSPGSSFCDTELGQETLEEPLLLRSERGVEPPFLTCWSTSEKGRLWRQTKTYCFFECNLK